MHDEIAAERQWLLKHRRGPAVIDNRDHALRPRQRRECGEIMDMEQPAVRAFEIEQPAAGQRRLHSGEVASVDIIDADAKALQHSLKKAVGVGIDMLDAENAVARPGKSHDRRGNRRHAAGKAQRVLGPLQRRDLFLKGADRRVEATRINRAQFLTGKSRRHLLIRIESEQRGLKDRRHHRVAKIALVMGDNERGCVTHWRAVIHLAGLWVRLAPNMTCNISMSSRMETPDANTNSLGHPCGALRVL